MWATQTFPPTPPATATAIPTRQVLPNPGATESATAINPHLGPLRNNGGFTPTHMPTVSSSAWDNANPVLAANIDQCGRPRPVGSVADIGAAELCAYTVEGEDFFGLTDLQPSGGTEGWSSFGFDNAMAFAERSPENAALCAHIVADASHYRVSGVIANSANWLPYSSVGTSEYVRAKFYVYAGGQVPSQVNMIPNLRARVSVRFAQNSMLEIFGHQNGDPAVQPLADEIAPSTDPDHPSVYRVDFDPVGVPYLASTAGEGMLRAFEAYSTDPQDHGYLALDECVIGTYRATFMPTSGAAAKTYQPTASDAGNLKSTETDAVLYKYSVLTGGVGEFPTADFAVFPQHTENSQGVKFDSSTFNNALGGNRVGIVMREFGPGADLAQRLRVEPGKQYRVRFHVTSTHASDRQPQLRLRARTVKFSYVQKLEFGGAQAAGIANNTIAAETLPGTGCQNPDKISSENGGYYSLLFNSPLHPEIRSDKTGTIAQRMPNLSAEPGPGANSTSRRDLRVGADLIDTLTFGPNASLEAGSFLIDKIEIWSHNLVVD